MDHINFSEIEQFRGVVRKAPKSVVKFKGTVKVHGTNAGVVMTRDGYFHAQSRNNILTIENDNAGFAKFALDRSDSFRAIFDVANTAQEVAVFGEWCGRGIQKGVGISELEKMFVIFAIKVNEKWVDHKECENIASYIRDDQARIFSIYEFPTFEVDIDFNAPEYSVERLGEITASVEARCPVAAQFGIEGIGEGVVWSNHEYGLRFKVKGEKHSVSKVKTLAPVDVEKLNSIKEFVEYAVTENRLSQARSEVTPDLDIKMMGEFIRWVFNDIIKEESDTLAKNNLSEKEIGKHVSTKARGWFNAQIGAFA